MKDEEKRSPASAAAENECGGQTPPDAALPEATCEEAQESLREPEHHTEATETPIPSPTDAPMPEISASEALHRRLAEEFLDLMREFPAMNDPDQLPDAVLETATRDGIPLLDAYLRFRWQEEKRKSAATAQQQSAAERSAGSLYQGSEEPMPGQTAFLRAFRAALR